MLDANCHGQLVRFDSPNISVQMVQWYILSHESAVDTITVSWLNNMKGCASWLIFALWLFWLFPDFALWDRKDFLLIRSLSEVLCIVHN